MIELASLCRDVGGITDNLDEIEMRTNTTRTNRQTNKYENLTISVGSFEKKLVAKCNVGI